MSTFMGILSISPNGTSSLNASVLLMAGVPDTAQAIAAATQFLTVGRNLRSGQMILVDGFAAPIGTAHAIRMTDAHAVAPEASLAIPLGTRHRAAAEVARRSIVPRPSGGSE